ncbi:3'(2'),5'-bisphosphate nucleotidase CysQ [Acuticoccus sp. MNP-M23]|uniref:inositol monophosphatase family protein n=1 Tax=Acuticoccus sp. MNP-M23 TaxID=3072793 RepID=UPI002814B5F5|nr:3'(2'),5'-bisphosphate nucleotidase CysQ [Acuticoccus sp. MNP-M23]WMS45043.1 3'(2'),5'-bisphosphate nucleotidase CysQ [Acuticoccus sp. MNP-M23]
MVVDAATLEEDAALIADCATAAGALALQHFRGDVRQWTKDDGSPVSDADLAVDAFINARLCAARPGYGMVSEEREKAAAANGIARTFVVDPIDGTRGFLRGEKVWSVVVAIIENGLPVAAAIAEPVRGTLYTAVRGRGALRNGKPIFVSDCGGFNDAEVAMPAPMFRDGDFAQAGAKRAPVLPSLALRLVRVAEGRFDGCVTKTGPHHWDLAAADLIVQEAGGRILNLSGGVPRYDSATTSHPPVVAAPRDFVDVLRARVAAAHATTSV